MICKHATGATAVPLTQNVRHDVSISIVANMLVKLFISLLLVSVGLAAVIEATDKDIDSILATGIPTILSIYASWCSHCKKFHPVLDELSTLYENAKGKIQFVKIDGDQNRKVAKKFKVEYFPTIKWVEGSSNEPIDVRDLESLKQLIEEKTGLKANVPKVGGGVSKVEMLNDDTLEKALEGKSGLVSFTASWCGHCKNLKPTWEELADVYANDKDFIIATVDCTADGADRLKEELGITGFPTIFYYDNQGRHMRYPGGRALKDFVDFVQFKGASFRGIDGSLSDKAGLISDLVKESSTIVGASEEHITEFIAKVEESGSVYIEKYLRAIKKITEGGLAYLEKETARLAKLLNSKAAPEKHDDIKIRLNILKSFLPLSSDVVADEKDEL